MQNNLEWEEYYVFGNGAFFGSVITYDLEETSTITRGSGRGPTPAILLFDRQFVTTLSGMHVEHQSMRKRKKKRKGRGIHRWGQ
jgi:hypothetical protein